MGAATPHQLRASSWFLGVTALETSNIPELLTPITRSTLGMAQGLRSATQPPRLPIDSGFHPRSGVQEIPKLSARSPTVTAPRRPASPWP